MRDSSIDRGGSDIDSPPAPRAILITLAAFAAVSTLGALIIPTASVASRLAHPIRVEALGAIPATTETGAGWTRLALAVGPWLFLGCLALIGRVDPPRRVITASTSPPLAHSLSASPRVLSTRAALAVVVALGLALRTLHLGDSLWYDEIAGLLGYSLHGPFVVAGNYFSQANHPLAQIGVWASTTLLGVNEFTVRLPALLASTAAIVAAWALGRTARSEATGLLMATAMAVMPIAVLSGSDGRGYALVILGATTSSWLLLRGLRCGGTATWTAFAIVEALTVWSHLAAVAVALGHGALLVALAVRRDSHRSAVAGMLALFAAAILTAMLHAPLLPDLFALRSRFRADGLDTPSLVGPEMTRALLAWGGSWTWWAALPGLLLALIGLVPAMRDRTLRVALGATALGAPIAVVLAWIGDSWLYARFLLFMAPAAALLMAIGLSTIARAGRAALALATAAFVAASALDVLRLPSRQDLRGAVQIAAEPIDRRVPTIGTMGLNDQVLLLYGQSAGVTIDDLGTDRATISARLDQLRPQRVILLYPDLRPAERSEQLSLRGYTRTRELPGWIDWGKGRVEVWSRPDDSR